MSAKQNQSPKTRNIGRHTRRGTMPGDKVIARQKAAKPTQRVMYGSDLLSAISSTARSISHQMVITDPVQYAFNKAGEAVLHQAKLANWDVECKRQAYAYLRQVFFGPIDDDMVAKLPDKVKRTVEMRFATSCWFQRKMLAGFELPGMDNAAFRRDYTWAERRFSTPQ